MNTLLKWHNRIFTNIKNYVSGVCPNVVRSLSTATPSDYPATVIQLISGLAESDLEINDLGAEIAYQADVYAIGTNRITDGVKIMDLVIEAFAKMGFATVKFSEQPMLDNPSVYRLTSRFKRFVGSGDDIEKIEQ